MQISCKNQPNVVSNTAIILMYDEGRPWKFHDKYDHTNILQVFIFYTHLVRLNLKCLDIIFENKIDKMYILKF